MKLRLIICLIVFLLCACCASVFSADNPLVIVEAKSLEYNGQNVKASGSVQFLYENKRMSCDSIEYNMETGLGNACELSFTTCSAENQHYRVRAREVEFIGGSKVRAKGIGIYLGKTRIIALPFFVFKLDGDLEKQVSMFPVVGYSDDGLTLSKNITLVDSDRTKATAAVQLGTSTHFRGHLQGEWALDGYLETRPGRYFRDQDMYEEELKIPKVFKEIKPNDKKAARLIATAVIGNNERVYDVSEEHLSVYRQPELKLTYVGDQLSLSSTTLNPRLEIYPQLRTAWGRFRERPGESGTKARFNIGGTLPVNLLRLGEDASLQAILGGDYYSYSSHTSYHKYMYACDYKRLFEDGSALSARYVNQTDSGNTPFNFDNVDVKESLQLYYVKQTKKHIYGFGINYDLEENNVYDWQLMYGKKNDCLAWAIIWQNKDSRIVADVALLSF